MSGIMYSASNLFIRRSLFACKPSTRSLFTKSALVPTFNKINNNRKSQITSFSTSRITRQPEPVRPDEDFWSKNARLQRPVSPHLSIYAVQLTSTLSIAHRITGAGLGVLLYGTAISFAVMPALTSAAFVTSIYTVLPAPLIFAGKAALGFTFMFKSLAGLRHLVWDTASQLSLKGVYSTGYATLAGSVLGMILLLLL